ncbi:dynein heavy chain [Entomophthora muscae]|uniref:Dynein heavy chain n=1 Tax=Entomophthora muscae TaxID=34485 RepID=A0ACC2SZ20_9FUNG|nr:dynein heavy chain [Entomophthora muscae]
MECLQRDPESEEQPIQEQLAGLQMKIVEQDRIVEAKSPNCSKEWVKGISRSKATSSLDIATNTLNIFEGRLNRLKHDYDQVCGARRLSAWMSLKMIG